jgi:hypothetical protein
MPLSYTLKIISLALAAIAIAIATWRGHLRGWKFGLD